MRRASLRVVVVAAALIACPTAAAEWNWADDPAAQRPEYAESVAICERVRELQPPAADRPDPEQARALAGCDSEALYHGIGMAADPVRARQCALLEAAGSDGRRSGFAGDAMLMTIYANGVGAERNLDLATAMACRTQGAPFEVAGRVHHLQGLKAASESAGDFGFCNHVTSGMGMAICARHDARLEEDRRTRRLDGLSGRWGDDARAAFRPLRDAAAAFAGVSADNEVDLSGSGRWAFVAQHEQQLLDAFLALLETLESGSLPGATKAEYTAADDRLNAVYAELMGVAPTHGGAAHAPEEAERLGYGTVTRSGVRNAQRAWLDYRDAWLDFAGERYRELDDSVATWLTRQRADDLAAYLPEPERELEPEGVPASVPEAGSVPDAPRQLDVQDWGVLQSAAGIVVDAIPDADPDRTPVQVLFDINCPYCGQLYRKLADTHPGTPIRWVPVAFVEPDSEAIAAAILAADDPAAALHCGLTHEPLDPARDCSLDIDRADAFPPAQEVLQARMQPWGGFVPMMVVRAADGRIYVDGVAGVEALLDLAAAPL